MAVNERREKLIVKAAKHRLRECWLVLVVCVALYLLLALVTYHHSDPSWSNTGNAIQVANAGGKFGALIADILLYFLGYFAYVFPFLIAALAWFLLRPQVEDKESPLLWGWVRVLGLFCFITSGCSLLALYFKQVAIGVPYSAGGVLGEYFAPYFTNSFNLPGATLLLTALFLIGLTLMFGITWLAIFALLGRLIGQFVNKSFVSWRAQRQERFNVKLNDLQAKANAPVPVAKAEPVVTTAVYSAPEEKPAPKIKAKQVEAHSEPVQAPAPKPVKKAAKIEIIEEDEGNLSPLPSLDLLDEASQQQKTGYTKTELDMMSALVETRLQEFGVSARVVGAYPGPVVTRFELDLAPGVKVSRITGLAKDLARSLSKTSVRVVEVIPGKSVIGIEIPNDQREMVRLKEILKSGAYQNSESLLSLALGKDIAGHPVVVDVAKMPHLLVAGTTGSGKSVSVNAMLLSVLFKATPDEVRLIMVDPKMLELSIYEGIPHLLAPVVTDMKEAANSFRWCVSEMDRRYRLMAALSVRNLAGYNAKVKAAIAEGKPLTDPLTPVLEGMEPPELKPMPQILIVVDELADMMMVVGKKVEELIARIAQKARAAGIHMILATQRPSVDVITGLIKANIPTRVAFQVSSRIDSRTILDQQGAEQLLGHGDMLYMPPGTSVPVRVHGAFVADEEVLRVVSAWKKRGSPEYIAEVVSDANDPENAPEQDDAEKDPLYDQAVAVIMEGKRASISLIQRRLKIGYNRAARMMEAMESAGLVSQMDNSGNRELLVQTD